jgi:orotidine-5'-phosphate decarboxylase
MVEDAEDTLVLAVTLLTSITPEQCEELFGAPPEVIVPRWAGIALRRGVHGIICSPMEIEILRKEYGSDFELITPGVRPAGSAKDDQARIATPGDAAARGADRFVIGRPITAASDPVAAARAIAEEIDRALAEHTK